MAEPAVLSSVYLERDYQSGPALPYPTGASAKRHGGLSAWVGARESRWSGAGSVLPLLSLPLCSVLAGVTRSAQLPSAHQYLLEKLSLSSTGLQCVWHKVQTVQLLQSQDALGAAG